MATDTNILRAFSVDHAAKVTRLSKARLTRWDKLGLFRPEYVDDGDRGNPYSRVYSYTDLVGLRTIAVLVDVYHVPMSEIKRAYGALFQRWSKPWSEIRLGVLKRKIVFDLEGTPRNVTDGQYAMKHIPLPAIADEVREQSNRLRNRQAEQIGRFEQHRYVAHNATVFAGTRIPVSAVQEFIDEGFSDKAIVNEYPTLSVKDVQAVRDLVKEAA